MERRLHLRSADKEAWESWKWGRSVAATGKNPNINGLWTHKVQQRAWVFPAEGHHSRPVRCAVALAVLPTARTPTPGAAWFFQIWGTGSHLGNALLFRSSMPRTYSQQLLLPHRSWVIYRSITFHLPAYWLETMITNEKGGEYSLRENTDNC